MASMATMRKALEALRDGECDLDDSRREAVWSAVIELVDALGCSPRPADDEVSIGLWHNHTRTPALEGLGQALGGEEPVRAFGIGQMTDEDAARALVSSFRRARLAAGEDFTGGPSRRRLPAAEVRARYGR